MRLVAIQKPYLYKIEYEKYFSKSELNNLASLRKNRQSEWTLGRIALKLSLDNKNLNKIEISNNKQMIPFITNNKSFCSIAHSCEMGVGIASQVSVGVDVEKIRPHNKELLGYIASGNEIKLFNNFNINTVTTYLWVIKESVLKALSIGISYPMKYMGVTKENECFKVKCPESTWFVKIFTIKEYVIALTFKDKLNLNSIKFEYLQ